MPTITSTAVSVRRSAGAVKGPARQCWTRCPSARGWPLQDAVNTGDTRRLRPGQSIHQCFGGANGAIRSLLGRAQELARGIRVLWPDQDLMGSHRRQAVAGPSATVGQSRQTFDARTAQPRAKQLSFGLGPDDLDDDQLVHTTRRYPNVETQASAPGR